MNGTVPAGPAPMPDNDENKPISPGDSLGSPAPETAPTPPSPPPPPPPPMPEPAPPSEQPGTLGDLQRPASPPPPPPPMPSTGSGAVLPPPSQDVDLRTMKSDMAGLKSSGGTGVESRDFNPSELSKDTIFTPSVDSATKAGAPKGKAFAIAIGIILVLGLAAAAVYFFVLPLFSDEAPEIVVDETPGTSEPLEEPEGTRFVHASFFTNDANEYTEATLGIVTVDSVNSAHAASDAADGTLEEIIFTTDGESLMTGDVMGLFVPGLNQEVFDEDFTAFVYHNGNGDWPGYVFLLDTDADANAAAQAVSEEIEESTNLSAFYPESPGAPSAGGFKNGSVDGTSTRYLSFGAPGASFNYGWSGRFLILSTSFNGFQQALGLLGS